MTLTNREDVTDTDRNRALLDGVAEAFGDAVERFCKHKSLRYTWMRYLPDDRISGSFWCKLRPKICSSLRTRPIFELFGEPSSFPAPEALRKVGHLYILSDAFLDSVHQPLLRATAAVSYISLKYGPNDRSKLCGIGIPLLGLGKMLVLLQGDLDDNHSWWRSLDRDADWQTRMSILLIKTWNCSTLQAALGNMDVVALKNGKWTAPLRDAKLLFPMSGRAMVPEDLGLALIHPDSIKNPKRADLMRALLVQQACPNQVVESILSWYKNNLSPRTVNDVVCHCIYLFWHGSQTVFLKYEFNLKIVCHMNKLVDSSFGMIYFPSREDNLGPQNIFKAVTGRLVQTAGHAVSFINDQYLHAIDAATRNDNGHSWKFWLTKTIGILEQPRLYRNVGFGGSEITPDFVYIMKNRPDILISLLHRYRTQYFPIPDRHIPQFLETKVLCETKELTPAQECVLPTIELRQVIKDLGILQFPFLQLDKDIEMNDMHEWSFTQKLGVLTSDSLTFYLMCLKLVCRVAQKDPSTAAFQIFLKLQDKCFSTDRSRLR